MERTSALRQGALLIVVALTLALAACSDGAKPPSLEAARAEAYSRLEELRVQIFGLVADQTHEWAPEERCGVRPGARWAGNIGGAISMTFRDVTPAEDWEDAQDTVTALTQQWSSEGHSVLRSGADSTPSVRGRINGVEYVLGFLPPDASLSAYLPCY